MLTQEIRRKFLNYFKDKGHSVIPSSPVLPHDDPTLLFTNAGMNQFKDVFLGQSVRDYKRAATSQKCIRVGGKHNDLDNVGHTSRHLTLFEMLGNFSFGDYFKEDAIKFAWEVSTKVFGFDPERIWPTVFREDDEAFNIWLQYVPKERITRFDEAENFWAMGDTGPCGPCSELLYDRGPKYGPAKSPKEDKTGERYLEFWNLVFMQFNRTPDGVMHPLPKPCVDTGAGLERIISLLMDVDNVFETDVLGALVKQVEVVSGKKYVPGNHDIAPAFHVIADHLRCLSFAIADGIQPSNVERGYVLRKVLRRAVRYGRQLGIDKPFLAAVLPALIDAMGPDYPELKKNQERIAEILTSEEEAFIRTLRRGGNILNSIIDEAHKHGNRISGEDAFKLKDTYGFPLEEIALIAKDSDLTVDLDRYKELEEEARVRSKSVHKVTHQIAGENLFENFAKEKGITKFVGYTSTQAQAAVVGIVVGGDFVNKLEEGQEGELEKVLKMEEVLRTSIIGQEDALTTVCRAIRRGRADIKDPNRPIGAFMFLGPTGVGKTLLARLLAIHLFGGEDALIQVDMSEYMEKFAVSRITGSPPGYVGHEEGGQLTERVRSRPYSVVLFDEIEKAHPDVMDLLLQILEEGRLTDSFGRKVDFRNTIVIMTSNLGADLIKRSTEIGFGASEGTLEYDRIKEKIEGAVKKHFKPEYLNRLDGIVIFHPLGRDHLHHIVDIEIRKLQTRLASREIFIELDESAKQFLVEKGDLPEMGARPLRRIIQQYIEDPLADILLKFPNEGRRTTLVAKEGKIEFVDSEVFPRHEKKEETATSNSS